MDIKLSKNDKQYINGTDDVFEIMRRVLMRDNKIDREKEHFWIIGMNKAGFILYIELIALGSVHSVNVEPMNVYRVAVMKNATRVIAIHNHPSGRLIPSEADKDITDRLIQVGRILNIEFTDHLIISPKGYISFRSIELMQALEKSLKYVPTYQVIEMIRREEQAIAKEKLALEKNIAKEKIEAEKTKIKTVKEQAKQKLEAANNKIKTTKEKLESEKDKAKSAKEKEKEAKENAKIAKEREKEAKERADAEREAKLIEQQRREKLEYSMATTLFNKGVEIDNIAKIMDMTPAAIEIIINHPPKARSN